MQTKFKDFLFNRLPVYFFRNDSYKDGNNKGLLQRYMEVMGDELDEEVVTSLENHLDILNINNPDDKYLPHIADSLGNPPDINLDVEQYKNLLTFITTFYNIKGTKAGYEFFFNLLNFEVGIEEIPVSDIKMDIGIKMDSKDNTDLSFIFDGSCRVCSYYNVTFSNKEDVNNNLGNFDADKLKNIRLAVLYNQPINAKLLNLIQQVNLQDTFSTCIDEDITLSYRVNWNFDDNSQMDNSGLMDELSSTQQASIQDSSPYCALLLGDFNNDFNEDYS